METMTKPNNVRLAAAIASLLLVATLIIRTTEAAFTANTDNTGNNWASGQVLLEDNDGTSAMFDTTRDGVWYPGKTVSHCITVTYRGNVPTTASGVTLGAVTSGDAGLLGALDVTVQRGDSAGAFGSDCALVNASGVYSGTLAGFTTPTAGSSPWAPSADGNATTYEFTVTLNPAADDAVASKVAGAAFTWTASS